MDQMPNPEEISVSELLRQLGGIPPFPEALNEQDYARRETLESDPANYSVEVTSEETKKRIEDGYLMSGFIDLSSDEGKYKVWLGTDHMTLWIQDMKFPDTPGTRHYTVGIKVRGEKGGTNVRIDREMIGQSCDHSKEQLYKILDAADEAMRNKFN
jgi:hypothetical protein